jgi:hypothetical protein
MMYGVGEILKKGSELQGEEQVEFMRKNFNQGFGKMIEYALEPEYVWDLPPGQPPFKPNDYVDQESNLYSEVRRMYIFMKGTGDHVSPLKKELNFVQLLENVSKEDAEFLLYAKEKTLPYGWTAEKIREIYPGLIWETTKENTNPDLVAATDEELGKPTEVVPDAAPLTISEEAAVAQALSGGGEAIVPLETGFQAPLAETVSVDQIAQPTKKQLAMAKARATRAANLAAKKSGTEKSGDSQ